MRTHARSTRSRRCLLLLSAALLLGADSASAYPHSYCPATVLCFFGEDPGIFDDDDPLDLMDSNSKAAEDDFLELLGASAGTEDFERFESGDRASLRLEFRDRNAPYRTLYEGRLTDRGTNDYGYIGTSDHEDRGFAISPETMWKNRGDDESLFRITFQETPMRAFGFYASGYKEDAKLELELKLENGDKIEIEIPHEPDEEEGNLFYFGVIIPPDLRYVAARLEYYGEDGDVMGFDNVTVSPVPEPSTALLLALGLLGLAAKRRARP